MAQYPRNTKPGGITELIDWDLLWQSPDDTIKGRVSTKFNADFLKGATDAGMEPCPGPKLEGYLKNAGFVDVHAKKFILPVGTWPADKHLVRKTYLRAETQIASMGKTWLTDALERGRGLELPSDHRGPGRNPLSALHNLDGLLPERGGAYMRPNPS